MTELTACRAALVQLILRGMNAKELTAEERARRLDLARQAFKEFYAQCFWSSDPDLLITDRHIPFVIRNLRLHGGHRGYSIVAELCR